jgi:hypothetical protein
MIVTTSKTPYFSYCVVDVFDGQGRQVFMEAQCIDTERWQIFRSQAGTSDDGIGLQSQSVRRRGKGGILIVISGAEKLLLTFRARPFGSCACSGSRPCQLP